MIKYLNSYLKNKTELYQVTKQPFLFNQNANNSDEMCVILDCNWTCFLDLLA